uniref:Rhomboid domain-containing protein n=1 Tax=Caenorhabditis japonica TaxID=281687 RepID=A0A8R1I055_CAEJA
MVSDENAAEDLEIKPSTVDSPAGQTSRMMRLKSGIPEETSFEVELQEMGDLDEAQGGEMDPSAIPRMKAQVRKRSSVRAPPQSRDLSELSHVTTQSSPAFLPVLKRGKSMAPDRPSNLKEGTRPFIAPSTSLPSRARLSQRKKKLSQEEQVLEFLVEESEKIDRQQEPKDKNMRIRARNERTISLVDEVFFDTPKRFLRSSDSVIGPAGMAPPELDAYHPDIAQSPPKSAILDPQSYSYTFDPQSVMVADTPLAFGTGKVRYHQVGNISYIDLGDSTLNMPKAVKLGTTGPSTSTRTRTDRPLDNTASPSEKVSDMSIAPQLRQYLEQKKKKEEATFQFARKIAPRPRKARQRGIGFLGKLLGTSYHKDLPSSIKRILLDGNDQRPWFTYWVTTVQIVVYILSLLTYDIGPWGYQMRMEQDDVMDTTLSIRRVSFMEPENLWFGPHYSDLIRLGALYSPCMRREQALWAVIEEERKIENRTGCCIANDHSGCYQSSEMICPRNVARWVRWDKPDPIAAKRNFLSHKSLSDTDLLRGQNISTLSAKWKQQRRSGAVCGQDPSYCDYPSSVAPQEWPDDITQWPICEKTHEGAGLPEHVTCQVTGRPCCIQLQGLCRIATRQYCDFVRGHWHENATLCSQVNCFSSVCGMLPFFGNSPNQFYRLFISLFIHAGLIHLIATIALQWWMMTDLEQFIGSKRMAILYLFSGIGGNLASAIFVPFNPEVGPSGSQCGLLAATIVDFYHHRRFIKNPRFVCLNLLLVTLLVFVCGLIPYVDNWAHFFGFIFGLLTTIIIFPYLDFPDEFPAETPMMTANDGYSQLANGFPSPAFSEPGNSIFQPIRIIWAVIRQRVGNTRTLYVIIASILLIVLFLGLAIIFFANIKIDCPWCIYFNCLPFFPCHNQGQELKKWLPI